MIITLSKPFPYKITLLDNKNRKHTYYASDTEYLQYDSRAFTRLVRTSKESGEKRYERDDRTTLEV